MLITSNVSGAETTAQAKTKIADILYFWTGSNSFNTWGEARSAANEILSSDITERIEYASDFRTKINALNNPDAFISVNLANNISNVFITGNQFQANGYSVATVNTAMALSTDVYNGLVLGNNIALPLDFTNTGVWLGSGTITNRTANSFTIGTLAGGIYCSSGPVTDPDFSASKAYLVEITGSQSGAVNNLVFRNSNNTDGQIIIPDSGTFSIRAVFRWSSLSFFFQSSNSTTTNVVINSFSIREIINPAVYQNTIAARPLVSSVPRDTRNVLVGSSNSAVGWGGASGGNAPTTVVTTKGGFTSWINYTHGGLAYPARGTSGERTLLTGRYTGSVVIDPAASSVTSGDAVLKFGETGSWNTGLVFSVGTNFKNVGVSTSGGNINEIYFISSSYEELTEGLVRWKVVFDVRAAVKNVGVTLWPSNASVSTIRFTGVQIEEGDTATAIQHRTNDVAPNIIEPGYPSFPLFSLDGSDDALLLQLINGGTVSIGIYGKRGSYLLDNVSISAQSLLSFGPVSILDDGVLTADSPTGIIRAVGYAPWSSRYEIVGISIMRANPSPEEKYVAMRYFYNFGAAGWLTQRNNVIKNSYFTHDVDNFTGVIANVTWSSGSASVVHNNASNAGRIKPTLATVLPNTLYKIEYELIQMLGDATETKIQAGDTSVNVAGSYPQFNSSLLGSTPGVKSVMFAGGGTLTGWVGVFAVNGTAAGGGGVRIKNFFQYPYLPEEV